MYANPLFLSAYVGTGVDGVARVVPDYFHGDVTRVECEKRLFVQGTEGAFLVAMDYAACERAVLSVLVDGRVRHFALRPTSAGWTCNGTLCGAWGTSVDAIVLHCLRTHGAVAPVRLTACVSTVNDDRDYGDAVVYKASGAAGGDYVPILCDLSLVPRGITLFRPSVGRMEPVTPAHPLKRFEIVFAQVDAMQQDPYVAAVACMYPSQQRAGGWTEPPPQYEDPHIDSDGGYYNVK